MAGPYIHINTDSSLAPVATYKLVDWACGACDGNSITGHSKTCQFYTDSTQTVSSEKSLTSEQKAATVSALGTQVGGQHYLKLAIQPVEYIHANGIGYFEGNVIKYVSRWRNKNGIADLEKAMHYLNLLIELEGKKSS